MCVRVCLQVDGSNEQRKNHHKLLKRNVGPSRVFPGGPFSLHILGLPCRHEPIGIGSTYTSGPVLDRQLLNYTSWRPFAHVHQRRERTRNKQTRRRERERDLWLVNVITSRSLSLLVVWASIQSHVTNFLFILGFLFLYFSSSIPLSR